MAILTRSRISLIGGLASLLVFGVDAQVSLPFARSLDPRESTLERRDDGANPSMSLSAPNGYAYVVDVSVGTPPQSVKLLLNPSVADTWVPDAKSSNCDDAYTWVYPEEDDYTSAYSSIEVAIDYCRWGSFNKSRSSTYLTANQAYRTFDAMYVDGMTATGDNFTDTLTMGDVTLPNYPIGLVDSADGWIGSLGLGDNRSSATSDSYYYSSSSSYYTNVYGNIPDRLVAQGKANTTAYSIWLDSPEGESGGILFGAIDTSRFEAGSLVRLKADYYSRSTYSSSSSSSSSTSVYGTSFSVDLVGANITATSVDGASSGQILTNDFPMVVTIGVAETFSYLPEPLVSRLMTAAGATYNQTLEMITIPCSTKNTATLSFQLMGSDGPKLTVELADLIVPGEVLKYYARASATSSWPADQCLFGIQNGTDSSLLRYSSWSSYFNIGSSLLRRAYLVFDVANNQVAVAPATFPDSSTKKRDTASSNTIVPFTSYGAVTPESQLYCTDGVTCYDEGGSSSSSSSSSSGRYLYDDFTDTDRGTWRGLAIGLGVFFSLAAIVAAVPLVINMLRLFRGDGPKYAPVSTSDMAETGKLGPSPSGSAGGAPASAPITGGAAAAGGGAGTGAATAAAASRSVSSLGDASAAVSARDSAAPQLPARTVSPLSAADEAHTAPIGTAVGEPEAAEQRPVSKGKAKAVGEAVA